eukprot:g8118.t1
MYRQIRGSGSSQVQEELISTASGKFNLVEAKLSFSGKNYASCQPWISTGETDPSARGTHLQTSNGEACGSFSSHHPHPPAETCSWMQ